MIPYEQAAGDSGKEKLSFDRKKPPAEPDLGRKAICRGWEAREKEKDTKE